MKTVKRLLVILVVVGLVGGITFYERPLWVELQMTHFGLLVSHVQSDYVETPEGRIHYYDAEPRFAPGHGVPLVLVHGLADRSESWAPMLERMKRAGFHVYALDLLGAGRSPHPSDSDYSISTQEQLVADFILALGLQKPDVGGWSMGGWITLKLALDHPEMVDRVVVYDSAGLHEQIAGGADVFHPIDEASLQHLADLLEPHGRKLPAFALRDGLRKFQSIQAVTDKSMSSMQSGVDLLDDRLSGFTQPVLIVWGNDDQLMPVRIGEKMHTLLPKSELDILEGCGHLAPKTCPSRVAAATADFLKANPAPSGGVRTLTAMH